MPLQNGIFLSQLTAAAPKTPQEISQLRKPEGIVEGLLQLVLQLIGAVSVQARIDELSRHLGPGEALPLLREPGIGKALQLVIKLRPIDRF